MVMINLNLNLLQQQGNYTTKRQKIKEVKHILNLGMNNNDNRNKEEQSILLSDNNSSINLITQSQDNKIIRNNNNNNSNNNNSSPHSIIYSNMSQINNNNYHHHQQQSNYILPQYQQHQSQSTILSLTENDTPVINQPQYALYSSVEDQKMLICKSQLVSFAQCFAQQKIQLENTVMELEGKVSGLEKQCGRLKDENHRLKVKIQQKQQLQEKKHQQQKQKHQHQQQHQQTNPTPNPNNTTSPQPLSPPPTQQQFLLLRSKLKQQFQKRIQAQKQFHNQKAMSFQLNKKIQFLSQKLVYQQQQLSRCQNLLKIKQDIIQNFQWERTIVVTARNNGNNNGSNGNGNNSINRSKQLLQQQSSPYNNEEQNSPLSKKAFNHSKSKNNIKSNNSNNSRNQSFPNIANNQTVQMSQINLINYKGQNNLVKYTQANNKKPTKYVINKKTNSNLDPNNNNNNSNNSYGIHNNNLNDSKKHLNDSKKKLNVSLKKNSLNNSLEIAKKLSQKNNTNNNTQASPQKQKQRHIKLKSVTIKRHTSTHSQQLPTGEQLLITKQKLKQFQAYYMRIITELQKQNQRLQSQLIKATQHSTSRFNDPSSLQSINVVQSNNYHQKDHAQQQMQRRCNLMKQKCALLQSQLQKTVTKYLELQQQNQSLQKELTHMKNYIKSLKNDTIYLQDNRQFNEQQQPLSRPSLGLADLVTPQFRQAKLNNNFFAKSKNEENNNHTHKMFQNISLHEKGYQPNNKNHNKNTFLDTFEKQKPTQQQHESCFIDNNNKNKVSSNSLFNIQIDDKAASNVFKGSIQDVSEIICRNDQQQVMEETF